jgi:hypothetical protein
MVASNLVNRKLDQMFDYRHRLTREDLRTHAAVNKIRRNDRSMTIVITGSSGFISSSLIPFLTTVSSRSDYDLHLNRNCYRCGISELVEHSNHLSL